MPITSSVTNGIMTLTGTRHEHVQSETSHSWWNESTKVTSFRVKDIRRVEVQNHVSNEEWYQFRVDLDGVPSPAIVPIDEDDNFNELVEQVARSWASTVATPHG